MEDDFAIMVPVFGSDINGTTLTLSVAYHEIVGIVGDAAEALSWLAKGVFPPMDMSSSSVQKRRLGGLFRSLRPIIRPGIGEFVGGLISGNQN